VWDDIRYFVAATDAGSFSEAAKGEGVSVATMSRRVEALEKQLGVRLFNRQVTGVELTSEGRLIYESAKLAAEKMSDVQRTAAVLREDVEIAPVVVSSTEPIISEILAPRLAEFWCDNPSIKLRLSVATANISLSKREVDIAIRLARPAQDNLVIKRLPVIRQGLFASKRYLAGRDPETLVFDNETFLGMDRSFGEIPECAWFAKHGHSQCQMLESSSVRALCSAAKNHCGIALIPEFIARLEGLEEIRAQNIPQRSPYLVFHRDSRKIKRNRLVRDWIVAAFEDGLG
jgi:DNA-binding transcriptional LysR family regulator